MYPLKGETTAPHLQQLGELFQTRIIELEPTYAAHETYQLLARVFHEQFQSIATGDSIAAAPPPRRRRERPGQRASTRRSDHTHAVGNQPGPQFGKRAVTHRPAGATETRHGHLPG